MRGKTDMTLPLVGGIPQWMGWLYGAVGLVAAITDYRTGKIYNWLTLPALGFGLAVAFVAAGIQAGLAALAGAAVAAALFVPLFLFGVFGGGDVKLLMAMGTVLGARGALELSLVSIVIASFGAVVLLFAHRRVKPFAREMWKFFQSLLTPGLQVTWPKLSRAIQAPFGIAIFFGFIYVLSSGAAT